MFIIPSCQPANEINSAEKLTDFDFGKPLPKDKESRVWDRVEILNHCDSSAVSVFALENESFKLAKLQV